MQKKGHILQIKWYIAMAAYNFLKLHKILFTSLASYSSTCLCKIKWQNCTGVPSCTQKNAQCSAGSLNHSDDTADASNKMAVVSREARKGTVLNDLKIHLST